MIQKPCLINFPKIGNTIEGYISVAENNTLPFEVKRVYWTYFTPESIKRGGHAHHHLEQILVAVAGKIIVTTQMPGEEEQRFILETANQGIFLPKFRLAKLHAIKKVIIRYIKINWLSLQENRSLRII